MPLSLNHPSSYRDPSGFLFYKNGILYRQVNQSFKKNFDQFIQGGLYNHLVEKKILIPHQTIPENLTGLPEYYQTLHPETIPFISYPYEWCFDMLKDAALLTIETAREAMNFGMMLKDASIYNIQLHNARMVFIDTLSFEKYDEQNPWIAYRQFCEHFFAPLALMHYLKEPLQNLFVAYPDGIPLSIAAKMLPFKSKLNLHSYLHLHLHASMSVKNRSGNKKAQPFSRQKMKNLLQSLEEGVKSFSFLQSRTSWSNYYEEANERGDYVTSKKQIINDWFNRLNVRTVFDAGANEGEFSKIAANPSTLVISTDLDHSSINKLYNKIKQKNISNICPLVIDLANPSPAIGVNNKERFSFLERTKADLTLALALVHHLALGRNIPFDKIAEMFFRVSGYLIIEFVPEEDDKVKLMALHKKDLFSGYSEENFIAAFRSFFSIHEKREIGNSGRTLYLMKKQNG